VTSLPIAAVALALSGRDEQTLGAATDLRFGRLRPLLRQVVPVDVLSLQTKTGTSEIAARTAPTCSGSVAGDGARAKWLPVD
jgi:hypothetical protein